MKKTFLKSAVLALTGIGLMAGNSFADIMPSGSWGNINEFLDLGYFPGDETVVGNLDFSGTWVYTAIARESGHINQIDEPLKQLTSKSKDGKDENVTFTTADYSDWGAWESIDFSKQNLYFEDSDGPYNNRLDPFAGTSTPGFKIFQLTENSSALSYLPTVANRISLWGGDYIIGFNDNSAATPGLDTDYDDMIIVARPVPEPATMLLFGAGLAGLAGVARRRKK